MARRMDASVRGRPCRLEKWQIAAPINRIGRSSWPVQSGILAIDIGLRRLQLMIRELLTPCGARRPLRIGRARWDRPLRCDPAAFATLGGEPGTLPSVRAEISLPPVLAAELF